MKRIVRFYLVHLDSWTKVWELKTRENIHDLAHKSTEKYHFLGLGNDLCVINVERKAMTKRVRITEGEKLVTPISVQNFEDRYLFIAKRQVDFTFSAKVSIFGMT